RAARPIRSAETRRIIHTLLSGNPQAAYCRSLSAVVTARVGASLTSLERARSLQHGAIVFRASSASRHRVGYHTFGAVLWAVHRTLGRSATDRRHRAARRGLRQLAARFIVRGGLFGMMLQLV